MADAIYKKVLERVELQIRDLALDSMKKEQVKLITDRRAIEELLPKLPGVAILPVEAERLGVGTNASTDFGYPVGVVMLDSAIDDPEDKTAPPAFDRRLLWREKIRGEFHDKRLSFSTTQTAYGRVFPRPVIDPRALQFRNLWVSVVNFIFEVRETRP